MADNQGTNTKQYFFDKPQNVNIVLYGLYISCAILVLLDFLIHRHTYHGWETLLGFYSIYGFIACTAIVLGSKFLRTLVERNEDYYQDDTVTNVAGGDHVDK